MTDAFAAHLPLPHPFDPARAVRVADELKHLPPGLLSVVTAAAGQSPFLARLALRDAALLPGLAADGPAATLARIKAEALAAADAEEIKHALAVLRRAKRQAGLTIALADIAGLWTLEEVTRGLTEFADACVKGALRFLLKGAAGKAGMDASDPAALEQSCGLTILAMGKYGAYELNYSSDIDLVVFYDADRFPYRAKGDARAAAVDLVKGLVRLMTETTADGYVFRTDLRLRPDAGATQVAISLAAAETYYEGMGQNWERAAMIKARACAGDPQTASDFAALIEPFVWRRSLDYAAIEDIHSIKRQIHAHGGHGTIAIAGHNIKLGRGGIREIEFFAQTQQLILGGRDSSLRSPATLDAIAALNARGLVSDAARAGLTHAYRYLRTLEHRLQMIEDQQTHSLPKDAAGLAHIAAFMGEDDVAAFSARLRAELETVQSHYARLFERSEPLAASAGSLVFTGVDDDPETIQTLMGMGFREASHVAQVIRAWHHGRIRATRSARARELLTKLMPSLLEALSHTPAPDAAFNQFDRFLSRLPAGVPAFSLFLANPHLLQLIAHVAGAAPRLAAHLGRTPAVLDALMDPGYLGELPSRARLAKDLAAAIGASPSYEGTLDAARRFAREQIFRVGVQIIQGDAEAAEAGPALANVAETVIAALLGAAMRELESVSGRVQGGEFCVLAMGKLGGREMTASSDLDLVFVYDAPDGVEHSGGARPLAVSSYFARLAQRVIAAITAQTGEGGLYEADMRLRPTGNKGPVAVSLESFTRYHASDAWTWERLALTRARTVAGAPGLCERVSAGVRSALMREEPREKLFADAREMREKLAAQFPGKTCWDLKFAPGGLVDLEFIAQTLQLAHATRAPAVLDVNTLGALKKLAAARVLSADDASGLIAAATLQSDLQQVMRIAFDGPLDAAGTTPGLEALLARAGKAQSFAALQTDLERAQVQVRAIFERVMLA